MKTLFLVAYFGLLGFVAFYGIHLYWLIALYLKHSRPRPVPDGPLGRTEFPAVTVQLPIFNEQRVALRLIDAVRQFDWPRDKLQIQILDDSTDRTTQLIADYVARHRDSGPELVHLHREHRHG
ncbi:MAG: glycosyltransferase, partial [Candidatus Zixiibacteriota bacterium]